MERKKSEQIYRRANRTKPVLYPTMHHVVVILYTKCELSIIYNCGDIFEKNSGRKKTWIDIGKNEQEEAGSQSHDATSHCQFSYKTLNFYLK